MSRTRMSHDVVSLSTAARLSFSVIASQRLPNAGSFGLSGRGRGRSTQPRRESINAARPIATTPQTKDARLAKSCRLVRGEESETAGREGRIIELPFHERPS